MGASRGQGGFAPHVVFSHHLSYNKLCQGICKASARVLAFPHLRSRREGVYIRVAGIFM